MRSVFSSRMLLLVLGYVGVVLGAGIALLGFIAATLHGPQWTTDPRVAQTVEYLILCGLAILTLATVVLCRASAVREYQDLADRIDRLSQDK